LLVSLILAAALAFVPAQRAARSSGVISGRVVDDEGRPIRGAQVQALRVTNEGGTPRMTARGNAAVTNDRGEFRLFWLESGKYYVTFDPNPPPPIGMAATRIGYIPSDPDAAFVVTYFPGTADIRMAEAVSVADGEVDIHAIPAAALKTRLLRMRMVAPPSVAQEPFAPLISLYSVKGPRVAPIFSGIARIVGTAGFEHRAGVGPGEYRVFLQTSSRGDTYLGSTLVHIDDITDPAVLDVRLNRTGSVNGQLAGASGRAALKVTCIPDLSNDSGLPATADVRPNGKFILERMLPGTYTVQVDGLEEGRRISGIRIDGHDALSTSVVIPEGERPVSLTITIEESNR